MGYPEEVKKGGSGTEVMVSISFVLLSSGISSILYISLFSNNSLQLFRSFALILHSVSTLSISSIVIMLCN